MWEKGNLLVNIMNILKANMKILKNDSVKFCTYIGNNFRLYYKFIINSEPQTRQYSIILVL